MGARRGRPLRGDAAPAEADRFAFWAALCAACSAAALQVQTCWLMYGPQLRTELALAAFSAISTLFAYLFLSPCRIWRRIAWGSAVVAAALYFCLSPYQQGAVLLASALWGLYYGWPPRLWRGSAPTPARAYAGVRSWPLGKPLLVAGTWAWVTVMLPIDPADWWAVRWMLLERAAFVFALALAYDLHDLEYDARVGLHTLVGRFRERHTFHLMYAALGVAAAAAAVSVFQGKYAAPVGAALGISLGGSAFALRAMFRETFPLRWRKAAIDALMLAQALMVAAWA